MSMNGLIGVRGCYLKHMYIPTEIEIELVEFDMNCNWKRQVFGTFCGRSMAIHSSRQTVFSLSHIECIIA